ncbi:Alpha/Beta hydrolase protein [Xylaria sp. FL1777]|nr:Alpha/Beta hydrolase protein [Xylaria sp. FL1777]
MTRASNNDQLPILARGRARLLLPNDATTGVIDTSEERVSTPLVICFHGSGETCSPSWDALATKLVAEMRCRVLLYDRGPGNLRAADVAAEMWEYVSGAKNRMIANESPRDESARRDHDDKHDLRGPYLLIAHSYGGAFARAFVQHEHEVSAHRKSRCVAERVVGLVLVETGQEGGLDAALDEWQIRGAVMGARPVCVVRGNSLLQKWRELEAKERAAEAEMGANVEIQMRMRMRMQTLAAEREMLLRVDAEDERLKRRQLGLSRNSRFVHVPDCGHDVVRQRPGEVVAAVRWVLENAESIVEEGEEAMGVWESALKWVRRVGLRR